MPCNRKHKFHDLLHRCECTLAGIYQKHGDAMKALRHWEKAHQAAVKSGDKAQQAEALRSKATVNKCVCVCVCMCVCVISE